MGKVAGFRYLFGGAVLIGLLFAGYLAATWMVSDLAVRGVRAELAGWQGSGEAESLAVWGMQLANTEKSIVLNPADPLPYMNKGILYEWRGFSIAGEEISASDILLARREATAAYREVTKRRPVLASDWASLARMKTLSGELDEEFRLALGRAMTLGANIQNVQNAVAYILSIGWSSIEDELALGTQVKSYIQHALLTAAQPRQIVGYLEGAGIIGEFCEGLNLDELKGVVRSACEGG